MDFASTLADDLAVIKKKYAAFRAINIHAYIVRTVPLRLAVYV